MKNIVFLINSIGSGGAESALFNIIKAIPENIKKDVCIHLVLLDDETQLKPVPTNVELHILDAERSLFRSLLQCHKLFKKIKPDIVVSFLVRANMVNSCLRKLSLYKASIVCERMHLSSHLLFQLSGVKAWLANFLPKILYKYNDLVLGVSTGVTDDLIAHYGVPSEKTITIYNPYDISLLQHQANQPLADNLILPEHFIVTVGRLTKSKDQSTLLKGFAKANTKLSLVLIGIGDLEAEMRELAASLSIAERVVFTGYLKNPHTVIAKAKFFMSTSRNEGFPNALLESMVLAKPIAFTSCNSGPAEILGQYQNFKAEELTECDYGLLIPEGSSDDVAKAIALFEDAETLSKYSQLSVKRSQDFTLEKIAGQYWDQILKLCH
jgi:glycosyltransferase involved in cell wall biosynthesis